jgi:Uma2 family endonuclease
VSEYWLVDPEGKNVDVLRLKEGEYEPAEHSGFGDTLTSPLFPGLKLPVASLWES